MKLYSPPKNHRHGYALMMVLIFSAISLMFLGAAMNWTTSTSNLNERYNQYQSTLLAAESATEKVMARMLDDFKNYGQPGLANNLSSYRSLLPSSAENSYWADFEFNDAQGTAGSIYVQPYGSSYFTNDLGATYGGLGGTRIPYRIVVNARQTNGRFAITNAAQQEVAFTTIPIFQFAIFYNGLMEFTRCAPMTINGRVHSNSSIYTGTFSSSYLTFTEDVTSVGSIEKKSWWDYTVSSYTGPITFQKAKTTNAASLTLPIGTNNTSEAVHKVIERPPADESPYSAMGKERFYNKAELLILVSSNGVTVGVKNPYSTASNNIPASQTGYFVSTNQSFYDQREGNTMLLTEIDLAKFNTWAATNSTVIATLGSGVPPSIVYVEDTRGGTCYTTNVTTTTATVTTNVWPGNGVGPITTNLSNWTTSSGVNPSSVPSYAYDVRVHPSNSSKRQYRVINSYSYQQTTTTTNVTTVNMGQGAVRLVNGQSLPSRGLTVATPNGLYVKGHYNCPNSSHLGTTNTSATKPASLVADAVTILSGNWNDSLGSSSYTSRDASSTTVNAAIVSGNVPSQGSDGDSPMSGGAHNLPRLLESWSGDVLTINGSLVCLFESQKAKGRFIHPGYSGQYYVPPTRNWSFDRNFLDPNKLPPGTPAVRIMERLKWTTPPINTVNYSGN